MEENPSMSTIRTTSLSLASFLIGIGIGAFYTPAYLFMVGLVMRLVFRKGATFRLFSTCLLLLALGGYYTVLWRATHKTTFYLEKSATFVGIVTEAPDIRKDKILLTITPKGRNPLLKNGSRHGRILVSADRYPLWKYGDELEVTGSISSPDVFNGFNYPLYLERFQVYGTIPRPKSLHLLRHNQGNWLVAQLYTVRGSLERSIQDTIPEPESSFLGGILLGSKRAIPETIQASLKQTGTSHIIAISGANITILLTLLLSLLPLYTLRSQFITTVAIGLFVTVLTGASASVIRGAVVASWGRYLRVKQRRAWPTPFLLSSMVLILVSNPLMLVADPGFQLSFAAFAGLAYLGQPIDSRLEKVRAFTRLPSIVRSSLSETTAATIGTAPLSLWLFHQLSLLGLLVNPLILWLLPPITSLGLCILVAKPLPLLISLIKLPLWVLLHTVLLIIDFFSKTNIGIIKLSLAPFANG